jgi:hypothetical protein
MRVSARAIAQIADVRQAQIHQNLQFSQKLFMMRTKRYFALSTISSSSPGGRREEEWILT